MVSLAVGGIALSSIYAVGSSATRHFREQQRISAAQTSLRAAMATLKHDFQRAGFMSTPDTRGPAQACSLPAALQDGWIGGVNGYTKNAAKPSKLDPNGLNAAAKDKNGTDEFFSVDQVWLTGNYVTSGEYPNISVSSDGLTVSIPMGWQSFQRDFSEWSGGTAGSCNETVFRAAFPVDRLVRLHAQNGTYSYATVAGADCVGDATKTATVTLRNSVPTNCNMEGGWIAPVSTMFYRVEDADPVRAEDDALGRTTVLRRTEVKPDDRLKPVETQGGVRIEDRSLLDYIVRFKVDFLMLDPPGDTRISYVPMTQAEWTTSPQRARAAIIDLAVRTPQQESDFVQNVPTAAFKIFQPGRGAARVRRMHAEVLMPNVANRNL